MESDIQTLAPRTHVLEAFRHREPAVLPYQWDMTPVDNAITEDQGEMGTGLSSSTSTPEIHWLQHAMTSPVQNSLPEENAQSGGPPVRNVGSVLESDRQRLDAVPDMKKYPDTPANGVALLSRLAVLAWIAWAGIGFAAPAAERAPASAPASGVEYRRLVESGPQSIHVVSFDLARGGLAVTATVGVGVWDNETVPAMVARLPNSLGRPVAAINGDYFEFKGEPRYFGTLQGMCIVEGELVASPPATAFWIDAHGRPHLGRVGARLAVIWPDGRETPFSVNCSTRDFKSEVRAADMVLYTPRFGPSTQTAKGAREWMLQGPAPDARWLPLACGGVYTARVSAVSRSGDAAIPRDGLVLSVAHAAAAPGPAANVGDTVQLRIACEPDMTGVRTAIAGGPMLLADGKLLTNPAVTGRAPRTAVGLADSRVWFVVVDGRQPATAVGMSHHELAGFMQRLGCTDALNLDGGGSSTLWYEGQVMNHPADGTLRPVGNALVLVQRP